MTMSEDEMRAVPPVVLSDSDMPWADAYEWAHALETRFPDEDALDLGSAIASNSAPFDGLPNVSHLACLQHGENDGRDWAWLIGVDDTSWVAIGGCDYTGWDCQSNLRWYREVE